MSNFINDGYERSGYFRATTGSNPGGAVHTDEVRFTYRPMMVEERSRIIDESNKYSKNEDIEKLVARYLAPKIVAWDIKDSFGKPVEVSVRNLLRLEYSLFSRLASVILYRKESGDVDPLADKSTQDEQASDLESALDDQEKN